MYPAGTQRVHPQPRQQGSRDRTCAALSRAGWGARHEKAGSDEKAAGAGLGCRVKGEGRTHAPAVHPVCLAAAQACQPQDHT